MVGGMVKGVTMDPRVWAAGLEQSVAMEPWRLFQAIVTVAESGEFYADIVLCLGCSVGVLFFFSLCFVLSVIWGGGILICCLP